MPPRRLARSVPCPAAWFYKFPGSIKTYGLSASHSLGDFNLAGEASIRDDMPLRSTNMLYPPAFAPQPQVATGRTAHINLSTLATFGPSFIARESSLVAELAWNRVLHKDDPDHSLDAGRTARRDCRAVHLHADLPPGAAGAGPERAGGHCATRSMATRR